MNDSTPETIETSGCIHPICLRLKISTTDSNFQEIIHCLAPKFNWVGGQLLSRVLELELAANGIDAAHLASRGELNDWIFCCHVNKRDEALKLCEAKLNELLNLEAFKPFDFLTISYYYQPELIWIAQRSQRYCPSPFEDFPNENAIEQLKEICARIVEATKEHTA